MIRHDHETEEEKWIENLDTVEGLHCNSGCSIICKDRRFPSGVRRHEHRVLVLKRVTLEHLIMLCGRSPFAQGPRVENPLL